MFVSDRSLVMAKFVGHTEHCLLREETMIVAICCATVVLGIDLVSGSAGPPVKLPDNAYRWEKTGSFRLIDAKGQHVVVRLYIDDSDSEELKMVPNSFDLHAMYRVGDGPWKHRHLFGAGRISFLRVKERTADGVILEFRGNKRHTLKEAERAEKAGRAINAPFAEKLMLKDGVPVIDMQRE
jgi:hypothetical protein